MTSDIRSLFRRARLLVIHFARRMTKFVSRTFIRLPSGFSPDEYLILNPDVELMGYPGGAERHYVERGRLEGRNHQYSYSPWVTQAGPATTGAADATTLFILHEGTRTGTPIIALGLANTIYDQGQSVALLILRDLGENSLSFDTTRFPVAVDNDLPYDDLRTQKAKLTQLLQSIHASSIIVCSTACFPILKALGDLGKPITTLVHEFPDSLGPGANETLRYSDSLIFSSTVVRAHWDDAAGKIFSSSSNKIARAVVSQQCIERLSPRQSRHFRAPQRRIRRNLTIVGCGTSDFRKGIDLFTLANMRYQTIHGEAQFLWIGHKGHQEDSGLAAEIAYLQRSASLQNLNRVSFLGVVSHDEWADLLESADLLLLPSRLDPLPNVALEALSFGLPVVSFAGRTGLSDIKSTFNMPIFEANFPDVTDLCAQIHNASASAPPAEATLAAFRKHILSKDRYASSVTEVARAAQYSSAARIESIEIISASGLLDSQYWDGGRNLGLDIPSDVADAYVRDSSVGMVRRPYPAFNPWVYARSEDCEGLDAFAHFIRSGCPTGPWTRDTFQSDLAPPDVPISSRTAAVVHIHVHYLAEFAELVSRLQLLTTVPDVIVTVSDASLLDSPAFIQSIARLSRHNVSTHVTGDGRNFGGLLKAHKNGLFQSYEYVCHLHTKRSPHTMPVVVERWTNFLWDALLATRGGKDSLNVVLAEMKRTVSCLAYPLDPNVGLVAAFIDPLLARGFSSEASAVDAFPVGGMFIADLSLLDGLCDVMHENWPVEPLANDGTLLHVLERAVGVLGDQLGPVCHPQRGSSSR